MPIIDSKPTSDNPQTQAPQNVHYAAPYPQQFEDDTIDLYELWITLWNKKWLVIAVTAIAALGSVVYAVLAPQIYKAEALLLPPKAKDVQLLNVQVVQEMQEVQGVQVVQGVQGVTVAKAFAAFKNNLSSRSLQKKFIDEQGLMDILAPGRTPDTRDIEILESFAKVIKIEHVKRALENDKGMSISMESDDPEFAANLVNDYISFFDTETILVLTAAARNSLAGQIRDIEYTIASKRQMAKQRREDTILRHEEAAVIAEKLGVRDRVDTTNVVQNNQLNISKSSTPLYYRGYRALNAEINILKNRKSDDPFISGLRDLQEILALLSSIKIEAEGMHAVTVDQAAYPPKNRFKPNRRLIVSLGTVVGLFLGIFLVFFVSFVQKQKETHSE
jgi:chain length determinant protein (polysaccharide antigen chain regulator)